MTRLRGCRGKHPSCIRYTETKTGLWTCPRCRRRFCLIEGGADSPLCDSCWGLGIRVRRRYPWRVPA